MSALQATVTGIVAGMAKFHDIRQRECRLNCPRPRWWSWNRTIEHHERCRLNDHLMSLFEEQADLFAEADRIHAANFADPLNADHEAARNVQDRIDVSMAEAQRTATRRATTGRAW